MRMLWLCKRCLLVCVYIDGTSIKKIQVSLRKKNDSRVHNIWIKCFCILFNVGDAK